MILGLDISTAMIGYVVYSDQLEDIGHITLSKYGKNQFTKTDVVREKFISLKKQFNIDTVGIEQYMKFFSGGGSRAQTMLTLAEFNGRVSQLAYDTFGVEPHYLNVLTARKLAWGSAREKNHKDQKLANLERVMKTEGNLKFEEKRNGGYKKHCFDEADAYTIARGLWVQLNEK